MTEAPDWSRDDVTRVLVDKLGFTPDPEAPSIMFRRGENLQLSIVDGYGTIQLAHNNPLWAANFTSSVPASMRRRLPPQESFRVVRNSARRP